MRTRTLLLGTAAAAAATSCAYACAIRPWWRGWGATPGDSDLDLPGDELVPDAAMTDTRGLDIDAPRDAIWPWLVQMGYGRAGWYSYDAIDMKGGSLDRIDPALQALAAGDLMPVAPDAGFAVRVLEPDRALVLYTDDAMVQEQAAAARMRRASGAPMEGTPVNLRVAGRAMPAMAGFAASWALVLVPGEGDRTRLIERVRVGMPRTWGGVRAVVKEMFGFGVFAMTRKQMLGIRRRAEGTARV